MERRLKTERKEKETKMRGSESENNMLGICRIDIPRILSAEAVVEVERGVERVEAAV